MCRETMEEEVVERSARRKSGWGSAWSVGKKVAIAGAAITSAPVLLPPLLLFSALGVALSLPFGVYFASFACTDRLMRALLPLPLLPPTPPPDQEVQTLADQVVEGEDDGINLEGGEASEEVKMDAEPSSENASAVDEELPSIRYPSFIADPEEEPEIEIEPSGLSYEHASTAVGETGEKGSVKMLPMDKETVVEEEDDHGTEPEPYDERGSVKMGPIEKETGTEESEKAKEEVGELESLGCIEPLKGNGVVTNAAIPACLNEIRLPGLSLEYESDVLNDKYDGIAKTVEEEKSRGLESEVVNDQLVRVQEPFEETQSGEVIVEVKTAIVRPAAIEIVRSTEATRIVEETAMEEEIGGELLKTADGSFVPVAPVECEKEIEASSLSSEYASAIEDQSADVTDAESAHTTAAIETTAVAHSAGEEPFEQTQSGEVIVEVETAIIGPSAVEHNGNKGGIEIVRSMEATRIVEETALEEEIGIVTMHSSRELLKAADCSFVPVAPEECEKEIEPSSLSSEYASAIEDQSADMTDAESTGTSVAIDTTPVAHSAGEDTYREAMIWEQIHAIRTIVGYKAAVHSSLTEELRALYLFTGVEPPISSRETDLVDVGNKLCFLKTVIGVK